MHKGQHPNLSSHKAGKAVVGFSEAVQGMDGAPCALCGALLSLVLCGHSVWSCSLAQDLNLDLKLGLACRSSSCQKVGRLIWGNASLFTSLKDGANAQGGIQGC